MEQLDRSNWLLSQEEQAAALRSETERKQYLSDLKELLATPYGYRFILSLLRHYRVERVVGSSEYSRILRNEGELLLDDIQTVDFNSLIKLITDVRSDADA